MGVAGVALKALGLPSGPSYTSSTCIHPVPVWRVARTTPQLPHLVVIIRWGIIWVAAFLMVGSVPVEDHHFGLPVHPDLKGRPGDYMSDHLRHDVVPGVLIGHGGAAHEEGEGCSVFHRMQEGMAGGRGRELSLHLHATMWHPRALARPRPPTYPQLGL